jgi:hypothetical protein
MAPKTQQVKFSEVPIDLVWCPPKKKQKRVYFWFDALFQGVTGIDLDKLGKRYKSIVEINDQRRALSYRIPVAFKTQTTHPVKAPLLVPQLPSSSQTVTHYASHSAINLGPSALIQKNTNTPSIIQVAPTAPVNNNPANKESTENNAGGILKGKSQATPTAPTTDNPNPPKAMSNNVVCPICKANLKESDFAEHVKKMHSKPKDRFEGIPICTSISQLPAYASQAQYPLHTPSQYPVPMMMVPATGQQWPYTYSAVPAAAPTPVQTPVTNTPVRHPKNCFPTLIS